MKRYTEDNREQLLTIAYNHGGIDYVESLLDLLREPTLELFMVESRGFIGKYNYGDTTIMIATKEDNIFTLEMWKYIKEEWLNPKTTSVISIIANHKIFDGLLRKYNSGYRIRNLLINQKES